MPPTKPDFDLEKDLLAAGHMAISGADEAGRGSLFGPVCVGMAVLPLDDLAALGEQLAAVRDSKQLPRPRVYDLAAEVKALALAWAVGEASAAEIDQGGIMGGIRLALRRAYTQLTRQLPVDYLLADYSMPLDGLGIKGHTVRRGDARSYTIACSALLAKQHHDARVRELAQAYDPAYQLDSNVGYGTRAHVRAIRRLGPTPHHRFSFKPVNQPPLFDLEEQQ